MTQPGMTTWSAIRELEDQLHHAEIMLQEETWKAEGKQNYWTMPSLRSDIV